RMADETATTQTPPERVKHSGPDSKFCVLCLSGEHERVDDEPAAGARQDGAESCAECGDPKTTHREGDDPVSPGYCSACPDDDAWHDYQPATTARQDGGRP